MFHSSIWGAPVLPEDVSGGPQELFQRKEDVVPGVHVKMDQSLDQGVQPLGLGQILQLLSLGVLKGLIQAVQEALAVLRGEAAQVYGSCWKTPRWRLLTTV